MTSPHCAGYRLWLRDGILEPNHRTGNVSCLRSAWVNNVVTLTPSRPTNLGQNREALFTRG